MEKDNVFERAAKSCDKKYWIWGGVAIASEVLFAVSLLKCGGHGALANHFRTCNDVYKGLNKTE